MPITHRNTSLRGFTIVELLIVIVVIAILAAITIVSYNGIQSRATHSIVQSDIDNMIKSLEMSRIDHGHYPTSFSEFGNFKFSKESYVRTANANLTYCADSAGTQYAMGMRANTSPAVVYWIINGVRSGGDSNPALNVGLTCDRLSPVPDASSGRFTILGYTASQVYDANWSWVK